MLARHFCADRVNHTMSDREQSHPQLSAALAALRRCGYAIGMSTVSAQGHTMVTVGGKVLSQEDIFKLAGMDEAAKQVGRPL